MDIKIKTGKLINVRTNLFVMFLFQENRRIDGWLKELNALSKGKLASLLKLRDFKGELNETALLYLHDDAGIRRVLLVGLGKKREFSPEKALQVFGTAAKSARDKKIRRFILCLTGMEASGLSWYELAQYAAESMILSLYRFTQYKTEQPQDDIREVFVFDTRRVHLDELRAGAERGEALAAGTVYARDLASHPGNVVTPSYLAEQAETIARENKLECTVILPDEMRKKNMNALLGVAQGSRQEPRLIFMKYTAPKKNAPTVAVVGKGLTFDAGGISLKPAKKMEEMKYDMCGAAAVLGLMKVIDTLKPPVNVVGTVVSAENMPGGGAIKPGDILKAYTGKTIEVINTDAEGRLVLADGIAYTEDTFKPDALIDLATLTGAVVVALGHYATGMLGNNPALLKKIAAAGEKVGEPVWELPIYPDFDDELRSDHADIKNSNGPGAGAIYGAAFLRQFVRKTDWAHLDIAGTAYGVKEKPYLPKGPTGVGVRLLANLLSDW